jgi:hypothetical protein
LAAATTTASRTARALWERLRVWRGDAAQLVEAGDERARRHGASEQELTLVHLPAQPEPLLTQNITYPSLIPPKHPLNTP